MRSTLVQLGRCQQSALQVTPLLRRGWRGLSLQPASPPHSRRPTMGRCGCQTLLRIGSFFLSFQPLENPGAHRQGSHTGRPVFFAADWHDSHQGFCVQIRDQEQRSLEVPGPRRDSPRHASECAPALSAVKMGAGTCSAPALADPRPPRFVVLCRALSQIALSISCMFLPSQWGMLRLRRCTGPHRLGHPSALSDHRGRRGRRQGRPPQPLRLRACQVRKQQSESCVNVCVRH